ncbi:MAG: SsrA-binding protein SmpB [Bdellovibrionales bacterium]|nr:SsrA-binding protein SmpB [Bdellovibrionales bacterium]
MIAKNKKAYHDFQLLEKVEAGIALVGTEVKSLRQGRVSLVESFVTIDQRMEVWLNNMTIPHYEFGNINNHEESRRRKLLLKAGEIKYLHRQLKGGMTIIPTIIYFKRSLIKIEIVLAKGKREYDKRHDQREKDVNRKLQRGIYD